MQLPGTMQHENGRDLAGKERVEIAEPVAECSWRWHYISFAEPDKARGFLGGLVIEGSSPADALKRAWKQKLNPGGEALVWRLEEKDINRIPSDMRNRLLSREEINENLDGKPAFKRDKKL